MTPLRRIRIRIRMSIRHRPFWIEVFSGKALASWGAYVMLMRAPIWNVPAFALLRHCASPNLSIGGGALVLGLLQIGIALINVALLRATASIVCMALWAFLAVVASLGTDPHPGVVLYECPIGMNAFALFWLIYDWTRRR